jgi:hypothetical protein
MQVFVRTPHRTFSLEVDPAFTVSHVKKLVEDRDGLPSSASMLLFGGVPLVGGQRTLADLGVRSMATLTAIIRLVPGDSASVSKEGHSVDSTDMVRGVAGVWGGVGWEKAPLATHRAHQGGVAASGCCVLYWVGCT